jgi:pimeloyl-ACP methyl ester carboxylesterase
MLTNYGTLTGEMSGTDEDRPPFVLLHGLTYDHRQWEPLLRELRRTDPTRRVLALDLPGHGDSPRLPWYASDDVAALVWHAVDDAGLHEPVIIGHDIGGLLATVYAANFPVRGVVNLDEPLLAGDFGIFLREVEDKLRSPRYHEVWEGLLTAMRVDLLTETVREDYVRATATPDQDLLLGYWSEPMTMSAGDQQERWTNVLEKLRANETDYCHIGGFAVPPTYRSWLTSILPGAVVTALPGSGHFPHLGRPADLARLLAVA